jgi:hypothetical protein
MSDHVLLLGWNRPARGHEQSALFIFADLVGYLTGLEEKGDIESFEPVLLEPHGGDLNGFVLIRGEIVKLREVVAEEGFQRILAKAELNVDGMGLILGMTGEALAQSMAMYSQEIAAHSESHSQH